MGPVFLLLGVLGIFNLKKNFWIVNFAFLGADYFCVLYIFLRVVLGHSFVALKSFNPLAAAFKIC